jgi:hypothetical protein
MFLRNRNDRLISGFKYRVFIFCFRFEHKPFVFVFELSRQLKKLNLANITFKVIYIADFQTVKQTASNLKTMARVSVYLNFPNNTEDAFNFYKSVFGGEFGGHGIARFKDMFLGSILRQLYRQIWRSVDV